MLSRFSCRYFIPVWFWSLFPPWIWRRGQKKGCQLICVNTKGFIQLVSSSALPLKVHFFSKRFLAEDILETLMPIIESIRRQEFGLYNQHQPKSKSHRNRPLFHSLNSCHNSSDHFITFPSRKVSSPANSSSLASSNSSLSTCSSLPSRKISQTPTSLPSRKVSMTFPGVLVFALQ